MRGEGDEVFSSSEKGKGGEGDGVLFLLAYSYGNRLSAGPSTGNPPGFTATSFSVDARTNRLTAETVSGGSFLYDAVGNLSLDGGFKYLWDAENRLRVAINQSTGLATTNIYDHIGRRVVRLPPGTDDRRYVYDISGQVLWEFPFLDTV